MQVVKPVKKELDRKGLSRIPFCGRVDGGTRDKKHCSSCSKSCFSNICFSKIISTIDPLKSSYGSFDLFTIAKLSFTFPSRLHGISFLNTDSLAGISLSDAGDDLNTPHFFLGLLRVLEASSIRFSVSSYSEEFEIFRRGVGLLSWWDVVTATTCHSSSFLHRNSRRSLRRSLGVARIEGLCAWDKGTGLFGREEGSFERQDLKEEMSL
nr:hypothetical protein Iba_chr11cCG9120 [Ipomoea batatas]GMD57011.1 hypothetical protein Iba_chr11eCG8660 [Ipomoea batatas]